MKTIVLLLAALTLRGEEVGGMVNGGYDNTLEGNLEENCDCGYALYRVYSEFDVATDDRLWQWKCIQVSTLALILPLRDRIWIICRSARL